MARSMSLRRRVRYGEPTYGPQEEGLPELSGGAGPSIPAAGSRVGGMVRQAARMAIGGAVAGPVEALVASQGAGGQPLDESQAELAQSAPPPPTLTPEIAPRPTPRIGARAGGEGAPQTGGPEGSASTFDKIWRDFKKNLRMGMK